MNVLEKIQMSILMRIHRLSSFLIHRNQTTQTVFSNMKTSLPNNVLIFEYKDRVLPFFAGIGFLQFIAFDAVAYYSYYLFGTVTAREDRLTTDSTLLERAATIVPTNRFRYTTVGSIVALSAAIFAACLIYPARCIRRLYLLKDGGSIGVVTFALRSRSRKFTVPLEQVSADNALHGAGIFHKLHIKNYRFSHLVNRREGHFHNKNLYETVIALKRF